MTNFRLTIINDITADIIASMDIVAETSVHAARHLLKELGLLPGQNTPCRSSYWPNPPAHIGPQTKLEDHLANLWIADLDRSPPGDLRLVRTPCICQILAE